jgi:hypothetical protein
MLHAHGHHIYHMIHDALGIVKLQCRMMGVSGTDDKERSRKSSVPQIDAGCM